MSAPAFVGSAACAGCHADQAAARQLPTGKTVRGDFKDAVFEHKGITTRFARREGGLVVETPGRVGAVRIVPVVGVAGIVPLKRLVPMFEDPMRSVREQLGAAERQ